MSQKQDRPLLGVDVGGTFTDAVLYHDGRFETAKTPTTPKDQSEAVIQVADAVLDKAGIEANRVGHFAHGMTVGTNALLENSGARTGMLITEGFADLIEIGRQARPDLYRLCTPKPVPLIPPELKYEVPERTGPGGVERPLDEEAVVSACRKLGEADVESIAVCLLFSFRNQEHERRVAEIVAEHLPEVHVSTSHDVVAQFREYERFSTTTIDAYLSPLLSRYMKLLSEKATSMGLPEPEIMQSSGGVISSKEAAAHGAWSVLSGPAGGAVCSAYIGKISGYEDLIAIDMGGTSCDVSVVEGGALRQASERILEGRVLQLPMLDIHTVGAGGGSIAWRDPGGALRVGPRSAGADPGPACYGRGGSEPTVTDANLLLGYLAEDSVLAGGVKLDAFASKGAVERLASSLDIGLYQCAAGIVRVANHEMLRALRVMTVERGIDPRGFALLGFGGAGPMHAAALAEELQIEKVICPGVSGVLSALGLAVSDRRRDLTQTVLMSEGKLTRDRVSSAVERLATKGLSYLGDAEIRVSYDLRYRGQAFELSVPGPTNPEPDFLREQFKKEHMARYGYIDPDGILELVTIRVAAISPGPSPSTLGSPPGQELERTKRQALFGGDRREAEVLRGEPGSGTEVLGPAIFELPEATVVVPPRWRCSVDDQGSMVLEQGE